MRTGNNLRMVRHTLALSLRADRPVTLLVGTLVLVQAGLVAGTAYAQRQVVNAAGAGLLRGLLIAVALGAVVHMFRQVIQLISHNLRNDLCNRIQMSLEQEITETAAKIPTITHLEQSEFLNRLTMLRRGTLALTNTGWAAAYAVSALTSIALSLWLLVWVHPLLALLAACAVPILPLANRAKRKQRKAIDTTSELMRQESALHDLCLNADPAKEVWISGNGAALDRRARRMWQEAVRIEGRARFLGLGGEVAAWALYFAAFAGGLLLVGHLLRTGEATPGDAILVISMAGQLRLQQSQAVDAVTQVSDGGRVAEHHRWLFDYAAAAQRPGAAAPQRLVHSIELRNLSYTYPGAAAPVFTDLNLTIPAGTSLGIVGINGAGKSTLVKLLTGVIQPTSGAILVDGRDLRDFEPASWAKVCTGAFQDFLKLQTPVRHAVGAGDLPHLDDAEKVNAVLARAGASELVAALPAGIDTQLGKTFHGVELSHGQWQRLALARGLMRDGPLLLLLDEPTAALDPQAEHDLFELFAAQTRSSAAWGAITVFVTHRFSSVHMADRIIVLSGGRIVEAGSHNELIASGGEYADLYETQSVAYR